MGTPLYTTDIIPLTSRPTLTVMDDGDYFVILDTSTGKISKILKTNIMTALKITYDNTSGLTAETVQAALDELVVNLGSSDSAILALSGRLDTLEGTEEGSVEKAIADAVSPLQAEVDTNRLYSDSQYLALKAKYEAQQIALNASKAELYTDDPILQYGAVEIIGKGYEANDTPIDVSANVVDGSLELEQKGLTITNLVKNGDFSLDSNSNGIPDGWLVTGATCAIVSKIVSVTGTAGTSTQFYQYGVANVKEGDVFYFRLRARVRNANTTSIALNLEFAVGAVVSAKVVSTPTQDLWYDMSARCVIPSGRSGAMLINIRTFYADATGNVTEIDGNYGVSAYNLTAHGLSAITDTTILAKLLPYVDGTQNVGKMGVQILDADDAVTQTIFLPAIGNSLPNGVADSIKTVAGGWEHTKRVSEPYVLTEADVIGSYTNHTLVDWFTIRKNPDDSLMGSTETSVDTSNRRTVTGFVGGTLFSDSLNNVGTHINYAISGWAVCVKKGTYADLATAKTALAGTVTYYQLATPITTHYDLPIPTSGKTIHRFAGEEKIALYGTGVTFSENVISVLSAVKFVAGVMTDITSLATITTNTVTFSGVSATDVVYIKVEHSVNRPLGILEHTPAVSNTASRLASLEARVSALEA